MITLRQYQEDAVTRLLSDTYTLLKRPGAKQKMVFKAPTGAGKTVIMGAYLNQLCNEIPDQLELSKRKVAFIWFAPNQLHLQSFDALKDYFKELRAVKPIQFEDITDNKLQPNEMLFVNWQSVNKANNLFIKENEQGKDLIKFVNRAKLEDTEIICILDEAHYHANGKEAQNLLNKIFAKIEIDVSATPTFKSDYGFNIRRDEVIQAEMIKKNVILNAALNQHQQQGRSLRQVLLDEALEKRNQLAKAYQDMGVKINPLLLIQLPNENKTESKLDRNVIEEVKTHLEVKGYTTQNERLAIWLSNTKNNLEGIEKENSMTDILLFKQAIALGWDCPRSAVLLIFREIHQEHFGIQTVGRILRMPEQKHYSNPLLNNGYVYTDLSKDIVKIVKEDMDYVVQNKATRIENYQQLSLDSSFINTRLTRNRLSSKFRKCLFEAAEEYLNFSTDLEKTKGVSIDKYNKKQLEKNFIDFDVSRIDIPIPKDIELSIKEGATIVDDNVKFAKTTNELNVLFRQFCRDHVGSYAKADSTPVLELALKILFEDFLAMDEFKAIKVILYEQNKPKFIQLIDKALNKHEILLKEKASNANKRVEQSKWDVPEEKIYNEFYTKNKAEHHALEPFYEYVNASLPEREFVKFLEQNEAHIEWWYKNGDKNKEDFAVAYKDINDEIRGFYVDFIIRLKNGTLALFDTKTLDSDPNFVKKHNALFNYLQEKSTKDKPLIGGVIVPRSKSDYSIWKYPENFIEQSNDHTGWSSFEPSKFNLYNEPNQHE